MAKKKPTVVNAWPTNKSRATIFNDNYRHMSNGDLIPYKKPKIHPWVIVYPHVDARNGRVFWTKTGFATFKEAVITLEYKIKLAEAIGRRD
jgi:hypothetical protein